MGKLGSTEPLPGGFGIRIDADLSRPLAIDDQADLRGHFDEHYLLVFPGQHMTRDDQSRVMGYLDRGKLIEKDPEFVSNRAEPQGNTVAGTQPLAMHSDSAHLPDPISAISLFALEVVDGETFTKFCSATRALQLLPTPLRERIDNLHTLHVMPGRADGRNRVADLPPYFPRVARNVVTAHPVTGDPCLYISMVMIDGIIELDDEASAALLTELTGYLFSPQNSYEHRWRNGDLVIWDNVALLHGREDLAYAGPRRLQRVSVGKYHTFDLYPEFPRAALAQAQLQEG